MSEPRSERFQANGIFCRYNRTLNRWTAKVRTDAGMVTVGSWAGYDAYGKVRRFATTHTVETALAHRNRNQE